MTDQNTPEPEWAAGLVDPDDLRLEEAVDVGIAAAAYNGQDGDDSEVPDHADD